MVNVWFSPDGGRNWMQPASLPPSRVWDLVGHPGDPANPSTLDLFYAAVEAQGVYRSTDGGASWTLISTGPSARPLEEAIQGKGSAPDDANVEMSVSADGRLWVAAIAQGHLQFLGYTDSPLADPPTWTGMDFPGFPGSGGAITGVWNTTPIVVEAPDHGLTLPIERDDPPGVALLIEDVTGTTAANGVFTAVWAIPGADEANTLAAADRENRFILADSAGNGEYAGGGSWREFSGLNPDAVAGGQGDIHFSIAAHPTDSSVIFSGGDRQERLGGEFPNLIGANTFTGNLWRGDAGTLPANTVPSPQWSHLTHSQVMAIPLGGTASSTAPHADSREMTFDAAGDLIEVDDGGVYRRTSPEDFNGDWSSLTGDLQVTDAEVRP